MDVLQAPQRETRPAQAVPPAPGIGPLGPGHLPPPFPMFPMGFPPAPHLGMPGVPGPMPPPPPPGAASSSTTNEVTGASHPNTNPTTLPPFIPPFPMMFPPPMFGPMFGPPTSSHSSPNLSTLSPEELRAMEGQERQHVEARVAVLRNIHSLLDSAIAQLNQYSQVIMAETRSFSSDSVPQATAATSGSNGAEDSVSPAENIISENTGSTSADLPGPSWAMSDNNVPIASSQGVSSTTKEDAPCSSSQLTLDSTAKEEEDSVEPQNDIRRRRIQRFASEPNAAEGQD